MSEPIVEAAGHAAEAVAHGGEEHGPAQYILHHVADGYEVQVPGGPSGFSHDIDLHEVFGHWTLGGVDVTPTKLTVMMWIAAALLMLGL